MPELAERIREGIESGRGRFTWVTVRDKHVCLDPVVTLASGARVNGCEGRHGITQTWEEWMEDGIPSVSPTVCGHLCRCVLVPADVFRVAPEESMIPPVDLEAAREAVRQPPPPPPPLPEAQAAPVPPAPAKVLSAFVDALPAKQRAQAERLLEIARRLGVKPADLLKAAMRVRGVAADNLTLPDLVAGLQALAARRRS